MTNADMSHLTADARAERTDAAAIIRRLVQEFLAAKRHEYSIILRHTTGEGMARESRGSVQL